ncbi:hypothetical protein [Williamsia sp. R60]
MPRLPDPTEEQTALLVRLERLARERDEAHRAYVRGVYEAADSGLTATQIAPHVGTSYQAVQKLLKSRK